MYVCTYMCIYIYVYMYLGSDVFLCLSCEQAFVCVLGVVCLLCCLVCVVCLSCERACLIAVRAPAWWSSRTEQDTQRQPPQCDNPNHRVNRLQKCTSKSRWRQGIVLKHRNSLRESICPVVICPYLCSSDESTLVTLSSAIWRQRGQQSESFL